MKLRCYNKNNKRYNRYGGRGITVCAEWKDSFLAFYEWALENGYNDSLTLDRINVDGNYSAQNCRWIPASEQMFNTSRNHFITMDGETKTMTEWANEYGLTCDLVKDRITKLHWSEEEAIKTPKLRMGGKRWLKS